MAFFQIYTAPMGDATSIPSSSDSDISVVTVVLTPYISLAVPDKNISPNATLHVNNPGPNPYYLVGNINPGQVLIGPYTNSRFTFKNGIWEPVVVGELFPDGQQNVPPAYA